MATHSTTAGRTPRGWTVRTASGRADAYSLARLWDHYFGVPINAEIIPWPCADIAGWLDEDDRQHEDAPLASCGLLAEHGGVRIGGGIATINDHEYTVEHLPDGRFDADALAGERNAWLLLGAVDPAWRGNGIGSRLFELRLDWARAQGASMVVAFGWERDGPSSRPLLERHGSVPVQRFPDYYAKDREQCPDCGVWKSDDGECECEMTLWACEVPREGEQ